jgi:hypothetical protein
MSDKESHTKKALTKWLHRNAGLHITPHAETALPLFTLPGWMASNHDERHCHAYL